MSFENGVIRIPMKVPVIKHASSVAARMCLDGVIGGQRYERSGDGPQALRDVEEVIDHWTVDSNTRIPKASQIIFEYDSFRGETDKTIYRSIFRSINDPEMRDRVANTNWNNKPSTLQRPYKSGMKNDYRAIDVAAVYCLFRGDLDRVAAGFRLAGRIGALRAKGGGEIDVTGISVEAVPDDSEMFGVVCAGRLMRPVPARCESALTACCEARYINGIVENWCAPYHRDETKELCLVPMQVGQNMLLRVSEIAVLAGVEA